MKRLFIGSLCLISLWFSSTAQPAFPLRISDNKRYFVDRNNKPFLYHADTGWRIYTQLTLEEARAYFIKRKQQAFNTIQTQIAATPEDVNRYGERPFLNNNDFARPNPKYFDHVARVIRMADSLGLLIVMSQPWLDCCMTGWGLSPEKPLLKNGPEKAYVLGKYFGKVFGRLDNLFWIMGGDHDPGIDREVIEQLAMGIHESAPAQLITYHAAATHSSTDLFQYAPWLGFSMIYTYWRDKPVTWIAPHYLIEVYEAALREYTKSDIMPFVLGEAQYEGFSGNDIGTPQQVRRQAYWTMLCGGAGHAYGSTLWNFPENWREMMEFPGAQQLAHFKKFFDALPWWQLRPDLNHKVLFRDYGEFTKPDYVTAAFAEDSSFFVAYLPVRQQVTVDMRAFGKRNVIAQWFNPRDGKFIQAGEYSNLEYFYFVPPGEQDWILYLKTAR